MTDVAMQSGRIPLADRHDRSPGWWGMVGLVATEAALFAYLIFSYFYLASMAGGQWLPGGQKPELTLVLAMTALLLLSSATLWWGERGIERGDGSRLRVGLLLTFLLGCVFLALQFGWEWPAKSFGPRDSAYGSLFFTITGFHGLHVLVGLLMNLWTQARAWRGHFNAEHHLAVSNIALYWHFVDAVWLVVLASLYLSPWLGGAG